MTEPGHIQSEAAAGRNRYLLLAAAVLPLAVGLLLQLMGMKGAASAAFAVGTAPVLAVLLLDIARSLRAGRFGLDVLAALSMAAALAFGEPLAGNVVALMYAGGQQLERFAEGRARREMTALVARAPRDAMLHRDGGLVVIAAVDLVAGDRVLVRSGDTVPADGAVIGGRRFWTSPP